MRPQREQILALFRQCTAEAGKPPGSQRFCKMAKLRPADVLYYWPRHSDLVAEAGQTPNEASTIIPEDELFAEYARVCVDLGHIPTMHELRIETRKLHTRTHTVYTRFGTIDEFLSRFHAWLQSAKSEYAPVLQFDGWQRTSGIKAPGKVSQSDFSIDAIKTALMHPFLPASLLDLPLLSLNKRIPNQPDGVKPDLLFERRCIDAFRAIGFEVIPLGQGKGRTADCLAVARKHSYGVIVDSKARADGYVLGTEDRKFIEYAKRHVSELAAQHIERVYLCIISSSFRESDVAQLRSTLTDSPIRGFALWPASHLVSVTERSIRERFSFSLAALEKDFFSNTLVAGS
jgi:hypothetical protein